MVLCRPASGSLRHPLNLTTSLFARMHFSFIQLQAPVVAYFPQQWHCCVPSRSMGDQIGVVDSGPSVCSEPHKCESDVWGTAAVEVWQHMCCVRLLVSLCSEHLSVDLLCSTLWEWQTADVRGSHLPKKNRLAISCCQKNLCCCSEAAAQLCLPEPGMEVAMFARQTDRQGAIAGQWKGPIVVEESDDKVF